MLDVSGLTPPERDTLDAEVHRVLEALPGVTDIRVALTAERSAGPTLIAIASGKGGVGKSTLTTNLAVALARLGNKVGVVDADIYGPSQPRLLGVEGIKPQSNGSRLIPVDSAYGVSLLSLGQLVAPDQAVAWRGPMAGNALSQLIEGDWTGKDVVLVDLPPGTGDVHLSMVQKHKPAGAVIVSTPQDLALIDARRAVDLFNKVDVPIIGLIENMAGYQCPHCGVVSDPFGQGGAEAAAKAMGLKFLGRVPLDLGIRLASDAGTPLAANSDSAFHALAQQIASAL
ncbi:MAG: Mrp/NBP35 family ATP-binding protein [Alphaproteobacteria bacterium]|nr:Mrp/NBP35 family ATP-binding protein [Alphaproteobacteria bacterium]